MLEIWHVETEKYKIIKIDGNGIHITKKTHDKES